jgi:hypothetical protein
MAILCMLVGKFAIKNINEQLYDESESAPNENVCLNPLVHQPGMI